MGDTGFEHLKTVQEMEYGNFMQKWHKKSCASAREIQHSNAAASCSPVHSRLLLARHFASTAWAELRAPGALCCHSRSRSLSSCCRSRAGPESFLRMIRQTAEVAIRPEGKDFESDPLPSTPTKQNSANNGLDRPWLSHRSSCSDEASKRTPAT